ALGLISNNAAALALGRLNVQSALGEPLRAEISVSDAKPEELRDLKVRMASPEAFRAAGVPYSASLSDVRVGLQRQADGRYIVGLSSNRPLSEPFLDLLVEANWSSGRIVRDYTVLLDPPKGRNAAAVAPLPPQVAAAPAPRTREPIAQQPPVTRPSARPAPAPTATEAPASRQDNGNKQVTVQRGDTAGKLAEAYKSADVSLDQMLLALLRSNPSAFIDGNVNRIKAGAILNLPSAAEAGAVPAAEARRTVTAQSRNFNDYRRRLADNAPTSAVPEADRQASGKLQANVEDRNAATASADKLKITQGGAGATSEEELAKARQAQASSERVAELSKNINELNKLQAASGAAPNATAPGAPAATPPAVPAPAPAAPSASPSIDAATPAAAVPPTSADSSSAPQGQTPASGSTAAPATPSPPVVAPAITAPKPPAQITPERGFVAELLDNPLMLAAAALIALLVAFVLYRVLGRKPKDAEDSVFLESRIPKDSFFGASGGESVDTRDRNSSVVSSLSYSPSQLDAGDVDPVAEADVYLAYGRDLQAEEILREALRVNPERSAIHVKLLEIHAKRKDVRAFGSLATELLKLTDGKGNDWSRAAEMGKELDPDNPLYDTGASNISAAEATAFAGTLAAATALPDEASTRHPTIAANEDQRAAPPPAFVPSVAPLDFDLDLSKPPSPAPVASSATARPVEVTPEPLVVALPPMTPSLSDDKTQPASLYPAAAVEPRQASTSKDENFGDALLSPTTRLDLDHDFDTVPGVLETPTERAPLMSDEEKTQPATLRAGLPGDSGFIEFDMSSLAGLSGRSPADTERARLENFDDTGESPHVIKLSLARELKALGDVEGARSLVEEVAAESSGDVKAEAKQLLVQLR
ncbi:MAG: hypothetical protein KJ832_11275, partial [Gammaproteobacteria bacterium]|nr:hypothetical protein [Gammaproteobacteria bacterium]